MRRHVWQRTLSHTSHDLNKSRPVPPIVKEARERIEQVQRISQPQQSTGLRLPPFPLDEQASDSAHVPEPSSILPSFRRQQLGTLTAALLAQTDYPSDTSESTSRTSRAVLDEAWLQRLPQHIESASNAVWLKAATGHDQRPIKHATPQLLRRCRKSNNKELTRTVLERKLSLDGLESIHATSWHTLAHHGWTIWVQATFLSVWLRRLLSLSESHFNEERKQWLLLWRCIHADLTKHRIPVDPALQDALLRWSELPPDGAKKNVLILQSLIQQYCKPLPAWSPSMCISLLAWLEHHRKCAPTDKQSRLADDIAHLADTIRSIFPPPLHVSLPQAAPTSSSDKALQRAYQSGHLAQGRGLLVTLLQANQFNATLPPSTWRLLRIHDPSLFVWTALRYLISLDDLTSAEKKAWLGLYLASRGPGQPGVAAETQAGLLTDETVKLWAKDRKSQADVQQAVSAWTDQVIGPGLCADFNGLFAKHFLHLCKHRQDLREEIATFLYRIAQLPIHHKRRLQMRCLHTLLHCHVGRIPTVQLVDHLETFLQKVFDFDVAQPQNSTRVPLDSGILRMLWLNMEQRAPVYEGFDGLLQRALDIIRPDHPYMGSELAQGMPDAAAILTRLGSKEIAYHRFVAGSEAKAKAVEDRLKDTLLKVNLRFQPSRQEEKDKFRAVRLAMSRSRAAGVDWTGFFEQQS